MLQSIGIDQDSLRASGVHSEQRQWGRTKAGTLSGLRQRRYQWAIILGIGSIVGLWFVGTLVDRRLQSLAVSSILIFVVAAMLLGLWGDVAQMIYPTVVIWGLAIGGFATITQTALSRFAGNSVDIAQAMYTTGWNTAVAAGGVAGGILLDRSGTAALPWIVVCIQVIALGGVVFAMNRALSRTR